MQSAVFHGRRCNRSAAWVLPAILAEFALTGCQVLTVTLSPTGVSTAIGVESLSTEDGAAVNGVANSPAIPTELDQLMLERINRARLRPGAEASRNGISVDEGVPGELNADPKPAVAFNMMLAEAARRHADDMLANDYFDHVNSDGQDPFDRMRDAGYALAAGGENLAWRGTTGPLQEVTTTEQVHVDLFVDSDVPDRGHRRVMLTNGFREVGVSVRSGTFTTLTGGLLIDFISLMVVHNYGASQDAMVYFILGVVYDDSNNNGEYDFGEGTTSATVTLDDRTTTTANGGGFTFEVSSGQHTITFNGRTRDLTVLNRNLKVDFVNGERIDVNLGLGEL